ncbi:beta subunit of N-acylethanolamine-hydrolyzing acid amidase-domain-containing protein [Crassisporium funariophilum]|nr:beta subunit of N-acylethanolamine-hydrolyzing acid amidase-domain-containing protein [Crassisporium funariophilum]
MNSPSSSARSGNGSYDDTRQPSLIGRARIAAHDKEPPLYRVDLSIPPESRYAEICNDYKDELAQLAGIYNSLLEVTPYPRFLAFLVRTLMRRVHSAEETQEIRGISEATSIPVHLLVAYNTFLDIFSGCISGGVQTMSGQAEDTRMLHIRGLDWQMEPLRDMIIRVEYILGGIVVARTVTYAGYLGVLTGVREGLSISLNYRPRIHTYSSTFMNCFHYLRLLLGQKPSIASQLRQILLSPGLIPTLDDLSRRFQNTQASSCYLTFCTPSSVLIVEKDLNSAVTHISNEFLAVTNHDVVLEALTDQQWREIRRKRNSRLGYSYSFVAESMKRKERLCYLRRLKGVDPVSLDDLKIWLRRYPIRNDLTHYSCIMDPSVQGGGLVWVETCDA